MRTEKLDNGENFFKEKICLQRVEQITDFEI